MRIHNYDSLPDAILDFIEDFLDFSEEDITEAEQTDDSVFITTEDQSWLFIKSIENVNNLAESEAYDSINEFFEKDFPPYYGLDTISKKIGERFAEILSEQKNESLEDALSKTAAWLVEVDGPEHFISSYDGEIHTLADDWYGFRQD
jgi:hypothetical protein